MKTLIHCALILLLPGISFAAASPDYPAKASAAIDSGNLSAFEAEMTTACKSLAANPTTMDLSSMAQAATYRELAHWALSAPIIITKEKASLKWLVAQKNLLPVLMSAITAHDPPDRLLPVLDALRNVRGTNLDAMPDLATAIGVVFDKPMSAGADLDAQLARAPQLLQYFLGARGQEKFDPTALPWQLGIYLVDVKITDGEIQWATQKYARFSPTVGSFFDVPFGEAPMRQSPLQMRATPYGMSGVAKQPGALPEAHTNTLRNLNQFGGGFVDQAYYATQICKVLGIPSCICTARNDPSHAQNSWAACLQLINGAVKWDFEDGQYKDDQYWQADVVDPQTQEKRTDADIEVQADLLTTPESARVESWLMFSIADLVPDAQKVALYIRAVSVAHANVDAWSKLAGLAAQGKISDAQLQGLEAIVNSAFVRTYPEFALQTFLNLTTGMAPDPRRTAIAQIAPLFSMRQDLTARCGMIEGDLSQQLQRPQEAMQSWSMVLANNANVGPIIIDTMTRVDKLLRADNSLPQLAQIYERTWSAMPPPQTSAYALYTPYGIIGQMYEKVLEDMGNSIEAKKLQARLNALGSTPMR